MSGKLEKSFSPPFVNPHSLSRYCTQISLLGAGSRQGRGLIRRAGFTLMELLVVVVIIGLLAGMLMTAVTKARRKATVAKATSTISALEGAISMYESDLGDYPASGNQNLVNALADINITNTSWDGPYMQFKAQELKGAIPNAELLDPWGNPYVYTQPGTHNLRSYDLYSFGPNGTDEQGVGDDIHNW